MDEMNREQDKIIREITALDQWTEMYQYLISLGRHLKMPPEMKVDENLISGCQSKLWLTSEFRDGRMHYYADSDALITRGILVLILRVLNNRKPEEIVNADLYFMDKTGLSEHLSPVRSNGLSQVLVHIKERAMRHA